MYIKTFFIIYSNETSLWRMYDKNDVNMSNIGKCL